MIGDVVSAIGDDELTKSRTPEVTNYADRSTSMSLSMFMAACAD
jgi:hypothetical protein